MQSNRPDAETVTHTNLLSSLVVVVLARLDQLAQSTPVLGVGFVKANGSTGPASHNASQSGLAFHNAVRYTHLTAECGHE